MVVTSYTWCPGQLGRLRMYLQVGSESLAARILGPAPAVGSKQSIALGRIFRTWCAPCKTMYRARRHLACHFEMRSLLCVHVYVYVYCMEVSPAED